jgi:hypothetical protein
MLRGRTQRGLFLLATLFQFGINPSKVDDLRLFKESSMVVAIGIDWWRLEAQVKGVVFPQVLL